MAGGRGQGIGRADEDSPATDTEKEAVAPLLAHPSSTDAAAGSRQDGALSRPNEAGSPGYDEAGESAFRAEARDRGEAVPVSAATEATEEVESAPLPPLDELVRQIPGEVREALDDLFRAKFIAVRRIPKNALDSAGR